MTDETRLKLFELSITLLMDTLELDEFEVRGISQYFYDRSCFWLEVWAETPEEERCEEKYASLHSKRVNFLKTGKWLD